MPRRPPPPSMRWWPRETKRGGAHGHPTINGISYTSGMKNHVMYVCISIYYILYYIILYCIILYYVILYYVIYYIILFYVMLYHIISYYLLLYYIILHYIILYHIILYIYVYVYIYIYTRSSWGISSSILTKHENPPFVEVKAMDFHSSVSLLGGCFSWPSLDYS